MAKGDITLSDSVKIYKDSYGHALSAAHGGYDFGYDTLSQIAKELSESLYEMLPEVPPLPCTLTITYRVETQ